MRTIGIRAEPAGCRAGPLTAEAEAALRAAGWAVRRAPDDLSACDLTAGIAPPPGGAGNGRDLALADLLAAPGETGERLRAGMARLEGAACAAAGLATLGKKLYWLGYDTPLDALPAATDPATTGEFAAATAAIGRTIRKAGFPPELGRLSIAVVGASPRVDGACELLDALPTRYVAPADLAREASRPDPGELLVVRAEEPENADLTAALPRLALLICADPGRRPASCLARAAGSNGGNGGGERPAAFICGAGREGCRDGLFRGAPGTVCTFRAGDATFTPGFRAAGPTLCCPPPPGACFPGDLSSLAAAALLGLIFSR